jgi:transcriptional regulator with XRE-family HTH domain
MDNKIAGRQHHPNSIVKFRGQKGWSISECATAANMDNFTLSGLERGTINLHDERAETLAELFKCTIDELRLPCVSSRNAAVKQRRKLRNLERGRGDPRWAGNLTIPKKAHPLVKEMFGIMNEQKTMINAVAERAGLKRGSISDWRYRRTPTVTNFEAALNTLGFELVIREKKDE